MSCIALRGYRAKRRHNVGTCLLKCSCEAHILDHFLGMQKPGVLEVDGVVVDMYSGGDELNLKLRGDTKGLIIL